MSNKLDVGIKLLKLDDEKFLCDGLFLVSVDTQEKMAKLIADGNIVDELPLVNANDEFKVGVLPGLLSVVEKYMKYNNTNLADSIKELQSDFKHTVMSLDFSGYDCTSIHSDDSESLEQGEEQIVVSEEELEKAIEIDHENLEIEEFDIKQISNDVKKSIVGQDEVVEKVLSNIIFNQKLYFSDLDDNDARLLKKNMLIFGKTGTGKTEVIKQITKRLDLPCVIEDATNYTIEGYKGKDVINMLKRLVLETDFDLELAEHSILIIDEIDKKIGFGDDQVNSVGVLRSLLKIIEGEEIYLSDDRDPRFDNIVFNTSFLTVICLGHFENLFKKSKNNVGFIKADDEKLSMKYSPELFISSGMLPEFMGRITDIIKTNDLSYDQIINIIKESDISPLKLQTKFFNTLGVKVSYDDDFVLELAKKVVEKKTGARAIKSCFDEEMGGLTFDALSGDVEEIKFEKGKVRKRCISNDKNNKKTD